MYLEVKLKGTLTRKATSLTYDIIKMSTHSFTNRFSAQEQYKNDI